MLSDPFSPLPPGKATTAARAVLTGARASTQAGPATAAAVRPAVVAALTKGRTPDMVAKAAREAATPLVIPRAVRNMHASFMEGRRIGIDQTGVTEVRDFLRRFGNNPLEDPAIGQFEKALNGDLNHFILGSYNDTLSGQRMYITYSPATDSYSAQAGLSKIGGRATGDDAENFYQVWSDIYGKQHDEITLQAQARLVEPGSAQTLPKRTITKREPVSDHPGAAVEPPPPVIPIPRATRPNSGAPRTLRDMTEEAAGQYGMSPEMRADILDNYRPVPGDVMFKVESFLAPVSRFASLYSGAVSQMVAKTPMLRFIARVQSPARVLQDNPVFMIGWAQDVFRETQKAQANFAVQAWWHDARKVLGFGTLRDPQHALKVQLASEVTETVKKTATSKTIVRVTTRAGKRKDDPLDRTINDLIERPERYILTPPMKKVLDDASNMLTQIARDQQRAGVNLHEVAENYWPRIIIGGKKEGIGEFLKKASISSRARTKPRTFELTHQTLAAGYKVDFDTRRTLLASLESGIDLIAEKEGMRAVQRLPGVVKGTQRITPEMLKPVQEARVARDAAKRDFLSNQTPEQRSLLRRAEADFILSKRAFLGQARQAKTAGMLEDMVMGRIIPSELADDVHKYIDLPMPGLGPRAQGVVAIANAAQEIAGLVRNSLTTVDLAAGFLQGQKLFYMNHIAWWKAQYQTILSLMDFGSGYFSKNFDVMKEGAAVGAIMEPTEFLFARRGIGSIPTRIPVVGPVVRSSNRAFERFIIVGQTELYKAARGNNKATEELVSLGSAIRNEMGTESWAILGVGPTQRMVESLAAFAPRFLRAITGTFGKALTGGAAGRYSRRSWAHFLAGSAALTAGAHYALTGKMVNYSDPDAPDWMSIPLGKSYVNFMGPQYTYFRTQARMTKHLIEGDPLRAAQDVERFVYSKQGIYPRFARTAAEIALLGESRTFDGEVIDLSPQGMLNYIASQGPISPTEAFRGFSEGRPEAALELVGLITRGSPYSQLDILYQKDTDINPDGLPITDAEPWQRDRIGDKYPELEAKAARAGRGVGGASRRSWYEVNNEFDKTMLALERNFGKFIDGEQIDVGYVRREYFDATIKRAYESKGVTRLAEELGLKFASKGSVQEQALDEWYDLSDPNQTSDRGLFSSDKLENLRDEFQKDLLSQPNGKKVWAYILRNTNRRTLPKETRRRLGYAANRRIGQSERARAAFLEAMSQP